ncbi:MAG TPA: hypothetical protein VIM70_06095 [Clostridium sp.]
MILWRLAIFITLPVWLIAVPIANLVEGHGLNYRDFKTWILYGYK